MSSHHIVRDDQEPALYVVDPGSVNTEILQNLLEWNPYILIYQDALKPLLDYQIKIDMVLCSEENKPKIYDSLEFQQPVKLMGLAVINNPVSEGLIILKQLGHHAVNLICPFDYDVSSIIEQSKLSQSISIFDGQVKWNHVKPDFKKWVKAGFTFQIYKKDIDQFENIGFTINQIEGDLIEVTVEKDGFIALNTKETLWLGEKLL